MKVLFLAIAVVSSCFAAEVQFTPKGGLLVFPKATASVSTTTVAPLSTSNEDLQSVNDRIMERLRQEVGSERGVYHVYLPDGRLQRVQYTTAPLASQQEQQRVQASSGSNDGTQAAQAIPGFGSGINTYYVQVPSDRLQQIQAAQSLLGQTRERSEKFESSAQYSQPLEVDAQFVPLQVVTPEQLAKYWAQQ